jgi:hydrogenase expression/formation protein HypD
MSGLILQGIKASDCPAFATSCTPERPLGATMVSSEEHVQRIIVTVDFDLRGDLVTFKDGVP